MGKTRCENCHYSKEIKSKHDERSGQCRRYPPKLSDSLLSLLAKYQLYIKDDQDYDCEIFEEANHQLDDSMVWNFPIIRLDEDWCGEFKHK